MNEKSDTTRYQSRYLVSGAGGNVKGQIAAIPMTLFDKIQPKDDLTEYVKETLLGEITRHSDGKLEFGNISIFTDDE